MRADKYDAVSAVKSASEAAGKAGSCLGRCLGTEAHRPPSSAPSSAPSVPWFIELAGGGGPRLVLGLGTTCKLLPITSLLCSEPRLATLQ